ncbi:zinc-binding dehydrogenase [Streptomyces sp. NPDC005811]|uniref:zinc-binding dehydrogenase n=1 Tax=Streptomyces sp. NPDC005811 TaxID=3154565 RepID=UPI0033C3793F
MVTAHELEPPSRSLRSGSDGAWCVDRPTAPQLGPGDALVAVDAVALSEDEPREPGDCECGDRRCRTLAPGWAGRVEATGPGASPRLVGRKVVVRTEALTDVLHAHDVRSGHVVVQQHALHLLPDTADLGAAALVPPAALATQAFQAASVKPSERVVVLGVGVTGLLLVQLLAAMSPLDLTVVDPSPERGTLALEFGATQHCTTVDGARVRNLFDVVLETTGTRAAPYAACLLAARAGRVVFTRTFPPGTGPLDRAQMSLRELTLRSAGVASSAAWSAAVRSVAAGVLDPRPLITRELPLASLDGGCAVRETDAEALATVLMHP